MCDIGRLYYAPGLPWSKEEEEELLRLVNIYGTKQWKNILNKSVHLKKRYESYSERKACKNLSRRYSYKHKTTHDSTPQLKTPPLNTNPQPVAATASAPSIITQPTQSSKKPASQTPPDSTAVTVKLPPLPQLKTPPISINPQPLPKKFPNLEIKPRKGGYLHAANEAENTGTEDVSIPDAKDPKHHVHKYTSKLKELLTHKPLPYKLRWEKHHRNKDYKVDVGFYMAKKKTTFQGMMVWSIVIGISDGRRSDYCYGVDQRIRQLHGKHNHGPWDVMVMEGDSSFYLFEYLVKYFSRGYLSNENYVLEAYLFSDETSADSYAGDIMSLAIDYSIGIPLELPDCALNPTENGTISSVEDVKSHPGYCAWILRHRLDIADKDVKLYTNEMGAPNYRLAIGARLRQLKSYQEIHGWGSCPKEYEGTSKKLGCFMRGERNSYQNQTLHSEDAKIYAAEFGLAEFSLPVKKKKEPEVREKKLDPSDCICGRHNAIPDNRKKTRSGRALPKPRCEHCDEEDYLALVTEDVSRCITEGISQCVAPRDGIAITSNAMRKLRDLCYSIVTASAEEFEALPVLEEGGSLLLESTETDFSQLLVEDEYLETLSEDSNSRSLLEDQSDEISVNEASIDKEDDYGTGNVYGFDDDSVVDESESHRQRGSDGIGRVNLDVEFKKVHNTSASRKNSCSLQSLKETEVTMQSLEEIKVEDSSFPLCSLQFIKEVEDEDFVIPLGGRMKRKRSTPLDWKKCQKEIHPPGPLCCLQFVEEIENGDFDEGLWRRMKRSRTAPYSMVE